MRLLTRFRVWFRLLRRRQVANVLKAALREFVYLDEVSVYSLRASRQGPIAAEFTETQTVSLQNELEGNIGATAGVASADITAKLFTNETKGSQVLRKSTVQATFKEFYEYELDINSFAIPILSPNDRMPSVPASIDEFIAHIDSSKYKKWIIDPKSLVRGQLIDLEVQLEADSVFRAHAGISAFLEILQEDVAMLGNNSNFDIAQARSIGRILETLLVGLIPIRGQAIDYSVVELNGKIRIIHHSLLAELSFKTLLKAYPLYIVGVAQKALFWKDIRLILFSKARYRILCRLSQDSVQYSWTPVKLANVLEAFIPGLGSQIKSLGDQMNLVGIDVTKNSNQIIQIRQQLSKRALMNYAELLIEPHKLELSSESKEEIAMISEEHCLSFNEYEYRALAFGAIVTYIVRTFNIQLDTLAIAENRDLALTNAGLDLSGNPISVVMNESSDANLAEERLLNTEIIAIYW